MRRVGHDPPARSHEEAYEGHVHGWFYNHITTQATSRRVARAAIIKSERRRVLEQRRRR